MFSTARSDNCEILIVAGASGSGKTTFIDKMIKGDEQIRLDGLDLRQFTGWKQIKGWRQLKSKNFAILNGSKLPGIIIHYDIAAQFQNEHQKLNYITSTNCNVFCITLITDHKIILGRLKNRLDILRSDEKHWKVYGRFFDRKRLKAIKKRQLRVGQKIAMYQSEQQQNVHYEEWFAKLRQTPVADHFIIGSQSREHAHARELGYTILHKDAQSVSLSSLAYEGLCDLHHAACEDGRCYIFNV